MRLQLIDEIGVLSEWLDITLSIIGDEESEAENEQSQDEDQGDANLDFSVGQLFASLLESRQGLIGAEDGQIEIPPPPTAEIESIDSLGNVIVEFSHSLVVIPSLETLSQDGILLDTSENQP